MDAIKIVGEWQRGGNLKPGLYLCRHHGSVDAIGVAMRVLEIDSFGSDGVEYFGPIEIVDPEPEMKPLPGCACVVGKNSVQRWFARSEDCISHVNALITYGETKRQAILRHNAAAAAIVAMEGKS